MKFIPHDYQLEAIEFGLENPFVYYAVDCGLGKTVISLMMAKALMEDLATRGVLVVAPLRVARLTWPLEIQQWDGLADWMDVQVLHGKDKLKRLQTPAHIYTINYEGLDWLCGEMEGMKELPFDMVIWDEVTRMKGSTGKRFKRFKKQLKRFRRRIGLTGTPLQSYLDLFGQYRVIDDGKRLGQAVTRYRSRFFTRDEFLDYPSYSLRAGAAKEIRGLVADITFRLAAEDHLDTPACTVEDVVLKLPKSVRSRYKQLEDEMFMELDTYEEGMDVFNHAALTSKCLQVAGGAVYYDDEDFKKHWEELHDVKIKALRGIADEWRGKSPLLVAYSYRHEAERILKEFPEAVLFKSGMSEAKERQLMADWSAGRIQMLVCHPASAGHGLNLQHGGHAAVWFTLNWSLELYHQFNKRIDRQGQENQTTIYRLLMEDTVDDAVATKLELKDNTQRGFLKAMKLYRNLRSR